MTSPYYLDKKAGNRVIQFFERELVHVKGEWYGKKVILEQWQKDFLMELFGKKDKKTGFRQYKSVWLEIPRKNGKSFWASGLTLYLTYADNEPGAENICAACDKEQADIVFKTARSMVLENEKLKTMGEIYVRSLLVRETGSFLKVVSADAFSKHGQNLHSFCVDEVHAQPSRDLIDVLTTSMGSRRQSLEIYLTTAGFDRNTICWEMHEYACKVRDGEIIDPTFLPVIYAADEKDDWTKEATWRKANPNYGVSVYEDYFKRKCKRAQDEPGFENTFKRLHLNMWTEQDVRWLPMDHWQKCVADYNLEDLEGLECYGGLDLSSTTDLTSLNLVFPDLESDVPKYKTLAFFWIPEENILKREQRDKVPYRRWVKDGLVTATPGNIIDYDWIRKDINELGERFNILEIAVDRWNATQLATQLDGDGFKIVLFGQGYVSMNSPSKELESLIYSGRLEHNNHEILNWNASNVATEQDAAGNIKPSKKKSNKRIDGVVAMIMGLGRASVHDDFSDSAYDSRGLIIL